MGVSRSYAAHSGSGVTAFRTPYLWGNSDAGIQFKKYVSSQKVRTDSEIQGKLSDTKPRRGGMSSANRRIPHLSPGGWHVNRSRVTGVPTATNFTTPVQSLNRYHDSPYFAWQIVMPAFVFVARICLFFTMRCFSRPMYDPPPIREIRAVCHYFLRSSVLAQLLLRLLVWRWKCPKKGALD